MSGEGQRDRQVIDTLIRDQVQSGVSPRVAEDKAKKAMTEADRRLREQGKR